MSDDFDDLRVAAAKHDQPIAAEAYDFLRAGGSLSLSDWLALSDQSAAALVAAGNRIRVEQALRSGLAARSREGAAAVSSEVDGGRAMDVVSVESFADAVAERVAGGLR